MTKHTGRGSCIDLFAGCGGMSLGIEQAGFDIDLAVDVLPENVETHGSMFSYGRHEAMDLGEDRSRAMRAILGNNAEIDALSFSTLPDVVVGGPPCQGISAMGRRDPADPRNLLMDSFMRHLVQLGARYGIMEQVPTLLEPRNAEHLDHMRELLHAGGYGMVEPRVLRAIDFGVPQRRERVFLLIHRLDQAAPEYPTPTHGPGGDMWSRPTPTVAHALDGLPDADDYDALWTRDWTAADHPMPQEWYGRIMRGVENDPEDLGYRRAWRTDLLTCSQRTQHEAASIERFLATVPGGSEKISRRHRLDPAGQSLTLRAGTGADKGSFTAVVPIHPKGTRVITVREAARLHSIPDWFILNPSKILAYRQIGNSVAPLLARAVGRAVARAAGIAPAAPSEIVPYGGITAARLAA